MRRMLFLFLLVVVAPSRAAEVSLDAFLTESFSGKLPAPQMLWLTPDLKARAARVLDHPYAGMRVKYWREGHR